MKVLAPLLHAASTAATIALGIGAGLAAGRKIPATPSILTAADSLARIEQTTNALWRAANTRISMAEHDTKLVKVQAAQIRKLLPRDTVRLEISFPDSAIWHEFQKLLKN